MDHYSKYFLERKSFPVGRSKIDENILSNLNKIIKEKSYFEFLATIENGGLFFKQSLQLYCVTSSNDFMDIEHVNQVLNKEYGPLFENLLSFGQDIFGNQFAFDLANQKVISFNCETGEKNFLADNFKDWLAVLFNDFAFYTGVTYAESWLEKNNIELGQRLVPIKPFVIGGDYSIDNFYTLDFPKYLTYNADIAKQIFNLKDGEKVKITYTKPL